LELTKVTKAEAAEKLAEAVEFIVSYLGNGSSIASALAAYRQAPAPEAKDEIEEEERIASYLIRFPPDAAVGEVGYQHWARDIAHDLTEAAYRQAPALQNEPDKSQNELVKEFQAEISRLHNALDTVYQEGISDYWIWMGDGNDHLESMGEAMQVQIKAGQLRALLMVDGDRLPPGVTLKDVVDAFRHQNQYQCDLTVDEVGDVICKDEHNRAVATWAALQAAGKKGE